MCFELRGLAESPSLGLGWSSLYAKLLPAYSVERQLTVAEGTKWPRQRSSVIQPYSHNLFIYASDVHLLLSAPLPKKRPGEGGRDGLYVAGGQLPPCFCSEHSMDVFWPTLPAHFQPAVGQRSQAAGSFLASASFAQPLDGASPFDG